VRTELEAYEGQLADKIEIVALNKIDAVAPDELKKQKDRLKRGGEEDAAAAVPAPPARACRTRCARWSR
jgi:GTPase involved in cell partitioning and DNA repair